MVTFHVLGLIVLDLVTASVNVVVNLLERKVRGCLPGLQDPRGVAGLEAGRREGLGLPTNTPILEGAYGHLITGGRPNPHRGHGIVRLRRLTVIIGHGRSLFPVQMVPL